MKDEIRGDQIESITSLARSKGMETREYIAHYSPEYIGRTEKVVTNITREEASLWISKANKLK